VADESIPALHTSASRDQAGRINLSLCNLDHEHDLEVNVDLSGSPVTNVTGKILTAGTLQAHNTFDEPEIVKPTTFSGARIVPTGLVVRMPAHAVVVLQLS